MGKRARPSHHSTATHKSQNDQYSYSPVIINLLALSESYPLFTRDDENAYIIWGIEYIYHDDTFVCGAVMVADGGIVMVVCNFMLCSKRPMTNN